MYSEFIYIYNALSSDCEENRFNRLYHFFLHPKLKWISRLFICSGDEIEVFTKQLRTAHTIICKLTRCIHSLRGGHQTCVGYMWSQMSFGSTISSACSLWIERNRFCFHLRPAAAAVLNGCWIQHSRNASHLFFFFRWFQYFQSQFHAGSFGFILFSKSIILWTRSKWKI